MPTAMHILFLADSAPTHSDDVRLLGTVESLLREGHRVSLGFGAGEPPELVKLFSIEPILDVRMSTDMLAGGALAAVETLSRIIDKSGVDVLFLASGVSLLIGSLVAMSAPRPYVVGVDQPLEESAGGSPLLQIVLEQALAPASRVYCASSTVARDVRAAAPAARCRPWPAGTRGDAPQASPLASDLAQVCAEWTGPDPARLLPVLERHRDLPIDSPLLLHDLVRTIESDLHAVTGRAARSERERAYEAGQFELIRARDVEQALAIEQATRTDLESALRQLDSTRNQLESTRAALESTRAALESTWTELGSTRTDLASTRTELEQTLTDQEQLKIQLADREQLLIVTNVSLAERERDLAEIKGSTGWGLLVRLWALRTRVVPHGSRRDRTLWAILSTARLFRKQGFTGIASALLRTVLRTPYGERAVDVLPRSVAERLDEQLHASTAIAARSISPTGTDLLRSWSDTAVLTVSSHPRPATFDVVVFPIIDWNFRFQRPQQLAARFAEMGHRVFYVAVTFCDTAAPILRPVRQGVVEIQLPGPAGMSPYADELDSIADQLADVLGQVRAQFNIADALCIANLPFWTPLVLRLRKRFGWRVVYDCLDDYSGFTNTTRRMLRTEQALARDSDLVLVTSRHLLEKQSPLNKHCALVPNASDFQHFRFGNAVVPADLAGLRQGHPIVGYYGAISDWFDSALVGALARARPDWEFVLIGSTYGCDLRPFRALSNVHLLGEKPYSDIPAYLHAFDVGIIPFKKLPLTEATNPVKLFEYASAGKPIVATDLAELRYYADYARLARTEAEWLEALDDAVTSSATADMQHLVDFGRHNSWEHRLNQLTELAGPLFPLASIIIVTYNNVDYTRLCLESIVRKTAYPNFELVIVDNGSTDGTEAFLKDFASRHANVKLILNGTNFGFAKANNIGLESATGDYIVFLNNDTIVTSGWLSRLTYYLRDMRVGMVGPVTNSSGNESKIDVDYSGIGDMDAFAEAYTRGHDGSTFEIYMLALFCAALRRATVDEVGNLDERFGIGMFEDDDYAMRVRARGYQIICAEDIFVHHWGGASFSRLERDDYQQIFAANREKFEQKWGITWTPHTYRGPAVSNPT